MPPFFKKSGQFYFVIECTFCMLLKNEHRRISIKVNSESIFHLNVNTDIFFREISTWKDVDLLIADNNPASKNIEFYI